MATKPGQNLLTATLSGVTAILYWDDVEYTIDSRPFKRMEYDHNKQKNALEDSGVKPIFQDMLFGVPAQITSSQIPVQARNLQPNDSDLANIYKKLFYTSFSFTGATTLSSDIDHLVSWASAHRVLMDRFNAHLNYAGDDNVSYQELQTLKLEDFSFLTSTGLTVTANSVGTLSNCFIEKFSIIGDYDRSSTGGPLKAWKAEFRQYTIAAEGS